MWYVYDVHISDVRTVRWRRAGRSRKRAVRRRRAVRWRDVRCADDVWFADDVRFTDVTCGSLKPVCALQFTTRGSLTTCGSLRNWRFVDDVRIANDVQLRWGRSVRWRRALPRWSVVRLLHATLLHLSLRRSWYFYEMPSISSASRSWSLSMSLFIIYKFEVHLLNKFTKFDHYLSRCKNMVQCRLPFF